jgi:hypothetical protein
MPNRVLIEYDFNGRDFRLIKGSATAWFEHYHPGVYLDCDWLRSSSRTKDEAVEGLLAVIGAGKVKMRRVK